MRTPVFALLFRQRYDSRRRAWFLARMCECANLQSALARLVCHLSMNHQNDSKRPPVDVSAPLVE
ncbi:hypothetical protein R2R70_22005, partial [Cobetia sp. SIMBA_158]|uniref:hypothetical protein n=1 Tax=Cobetia sp. SIMBA_158 TaxID=3081617 RepID=UPI00397EB852